jgi:hypothetical protein
MDEQHQGQKSDKWPELDRVEQRLEDMKKRNRTLKDAVAYTRSAGCLVRGGAAVCFMAALLCWQIVGDTSLAVSAGIVGVILLIVARLVGRKNEPGNT